MTELLDRPQKARDLCALQPVIDDRRLVQLVRRILGCNETFENCVNGASNHENGFIKIPLLNYQDKKRRARLHFWPECVQDQNIHDHRFDFNSYVVRGWIENIVWKADAKGEEFFSFKYFNDNNGRRMVPSGRMRLSVAAKHRIYQGKAYVVDRDILHTISHSARTITVIVEDRSELKPFATVYRSSCHQAELTPPIPVNREKVRQLLEGLLK
jgi:hypothetical protein